MHALTRWNTIALLALATACGDSEKLSGEAAPDDTGGAAGDAAVDADEDGVPAEEDCDDADASSTAIADDADCDGVPTADDCDDADASSTAIADDADCDGVLSADDCDDTDASSAAVADDADCDGVLTADDCDDADAALPANDADCDGVPTADDCDDADESSTVVADDADCDGVLTADDCDDADPMLPANDADCDGVATADDCDDADASVPVADDPDCDGVPTHAAGGNMIRIAASSFDIGCTDGQFDCEDDESPVMPVVLTHDFYMGENEVTQAQYELLTGTNPSFFSECGSECPVETVSWHGAAAYANLLSAAAGLTDCYTCSGSGDSLECDVAMSPYDCDGYRLPTEAEWEGSARCGEDFQYAGSDDIDAVAWYEFNSDGVPHPVGEKDVNACGLYDMSGNVFDWTQDWYDDAYFESGSRTDPVGADSGDARVIRGGSWRGTTFRARVARRSHLDPTSADYDLGFRLARTIP